jgi:hypothetical protein
MSKDIYSKREIMSNSSNDTPLMICSDEYLNCDCFKVPEGSLIYRPKNVPGFCSQG